MNGLEKLVPPLELCKQIPAGEFADSKLVYTDVSGDFFRIWERDSLIFASWKTTKENTFPATALEEIAEKTPGGINVYFDDKCVEAVDFECCGEPAMEFWKDKENAATAALRLWQRIRKAEREG